MPEFSSLTRILISMVALCLPMAAIFAADAPLYPDPPREYWERMAAWRHAMVSMDETVPHANLSTYVYDKFAFVENYGLAKMVIERADDPGSEATPLKVLSVEDFPGGVTALFEGGGIRVTAQLIATPRGDETPEWDGGAILTLASDPPAPLRVRLGDGIRKSTFPAEWRRSPSVGKEGDDVILGADGVALLTSAAYPSRVAVRSDGALSVSPGDAGGKKLVAMFPEGRGYLTVAFSETEAGARALAAEDATILRVDLDAYYAKLLENRIETPEPVLDAAFKGALTTLEYNWTPPYGWNECIQHWLALWHMQHTAGASWIGQADRAKACNIATAERLMPGGAVPQLTAPGFIHRDFGGSNQYFTWQVRHHWLFTGDKEAAALLAPKLDEVIAQTRREYDPDGDLLFSWGLQVGNQEDYVATPYSGTSSTVEGINMLRTRAMLARALNDESKALECEALAALGAKRMRETLWLRDLGRYAFFRDAHGEERLEGQYHTLIYPVIWGLLDPFDSYTSIRHMRDRLMGAQGEVYCSNTFANHVGGTWGMQAGEAQQPWAAEGLAAVGLRNETVLPLLAGARWAMDKNHRGSWPEVSTEGCPAYFSPPAGLFIQAVAESLFGLHVNIPAGVLTIAPSFPDTWPKATAHFAAYGASYENAGGVLTYAVSSDVPLVRELRWKLPIGKVESLTLDGQPLPFTIEGGVGCMELRANTPSVTTSTFAVKLVPLDARLQAKASLPEGGVASLTVNGARVMGVQDPCGVLAHVKLMDGGALASLREGLLTPYKPYGRFGLLNFARRTVFIECMSAEGLRFWLPWDFAVLPRSEATVRLDDDSGACRVMVRNNGDAPISGEARLRVVGQQFPFSLTVERGAQTEQNLALPSWLLGLLSPGDNKAAIVLPDGQCIDTVLDASPAYAANMALMSYAALRNLHVELPADALTADTCWRSIRTWYSYGHMPWAGSKPPLEGLADQKSLVVDGLPGVTFTLPDRSFVPVSRALGKQAFHLPLPGGVYRKAFLLMIPFLDNHDSHAAVARVTVTRKDGGQVARTLYSPGDLDWWNPTALVGDFCTADKGKPDRFGLLPMLAPQTGDWKEGKPPLMSNKEWWASFKAAITPATVMNAVEVDLGESVELASLTVESLGTDPAFGVVAVTLEKAVGQETLDATPFAPPAALREPRMVFDSEDPGMRDWWKLEDDAFSFCSVPSLFSTVTLNSLGKAGEAATGMALSAPIAIGPADGRMVLEMQGGHSEAIGDFPASLDALGDPTAFDGLLAILVVSPDGPEVLKCEPWTTSSHNLMRHELDVTPWRGQSIRIALVDRNKNNSFAWMGVRRVVLAP